MKVNNESDIVEVCAQQIMVSARTAPKSRGIDSLIIGVINEEDKARILAEMGELFKETGRNLFKRDAKNLEDSDGCILFAIQSKSIGLNCGACGYNCDELDQHAGSKSEHYNGPICIFKAMDLGIALGSAGKRAMELSIDNRLMYSVGLAAKRTKVVQGDVVVAMPLSVTGKNIYFDRK